MKQKNKKPSSTKQDNSSENLQEEKINQATKLKKEIKKLKSELKTKTIPKKKEEKKTIPKKKEEKKIIPKKKEEKKTIPKKKEEKKTIPKKKEEKKTIPKKKEEKKTTEEELEEQLTDEEIKNFQIKTMDMDKLIHKVCEIVVRYGTDGMLQSDLWKKLKLSSRDGSRLALKLERMEIITREKLLEKGRWTYKLIIKKTPVTTQSLEEAPCLTCPVEQKCSLEGEISPRTCQWIEDWVLVQISKSTKKLK